MYMVKKGKQGIFKNIAMPLLSVIACLFMVFAAVYAHGIHSYNVAAEKGEFSFPVAAYLIVFAVIMFIGAAFYKKNPDIKR